MEVVELPLAGLKLLRPTVFRDRRGFFVETYREARYRAAGVNCAFVQDNHSHSVHGTLRGLHYQSTPGQAKLVRVASGSTYHVVVNVRPDSATFGHSHATELDARDHAQLFVPVGFAHGFCVLSDTADVAYKVSSPHEPAAELCIRWNDTDLAIQWPTNTPILSERDELGESFATFSARLRGR